METMKNKLILYASMLLFVTVGFSPLVLIDKINITFPVAEQAVQGKVEILGEIDIDDFTDEDLNLMAAITKHSACQKRLRR